AQRRDRDRVRGVAVKVDLALRRVMQGAPFAENGNASQEIATLVQSVAPLEERDGAVIEPKGDVEGVGRRHAGREGRDGAGEDAYRRRAHEPGGKVDRMDAVVDDVT